MNSKTINDFHKSYITDAYEFLGCHREAEGCHVFRVFAPHALAVSVVGDYNEWDSAVHPMHRISDQGIWETKIFGLPIFTNYKYWIKNKSKSFFKQDPYGFHFETNGGTCAKIYDLDEFQFTDQDWFAQKAKKTIYESPMNVYEVHLGSWKRYKNNSPFNYRKIADELIPYAKRMGFTHLEVMPIMEFPFEGSWGYQVTGYFSVTSRYGQPADFMYFVNKAHQSGLGVILDWVPAHFPKDGFGLYEFDGEDVYEDPNPFRREHANWGTRIFNFQKPEVKSFLISSARFFFEKYHLDGLRVDAVASMLYLDYDRKEWQPNIYGGNHNLESIDFLKTLNTEIFKYFPTALMIAEESTDFANVSKPVYMGGLGFNFKWNMGWMNDTLYYMKTNPMFRRYQHNKLTFSLVYAFSENYVLPISHDEVVHGKHSLLDKMPGTYDEKFANLRAFLGYMMTHPGKKLSFMGYEFGQFTEWNYSKELDWLLLGYEKHQKLFQYVKDLNKFYLNHSCLWEIDCSWEGFKWINSDDADYNCLSFRRINAHKRELIIAINFSGINLTDYRLGLRSGSYQEVMNSDALIYGGSGLSNSNLRTSSVPCHGSDSSLILNISAFSIVILKRIGKE